MYVQVLSITIAIVAMLSSCVPGLAQSQMVPKDEETFVKELKKIKSLSAAGNADAVAQQLEAFSQKLQKSKLPTIKRLTFFQEALSSVMWSPVDKDDTLHGLVAKLGMDAIATTRVNGIKKSELLKQQCEIAMKVLPRTSVFPDQIAPLSLELWNDLTSAIEHYSAYDSSHPKVKLEIPMPPAGFKESFKSGMAPDTIKDPQFRKQYADYLKKRNEFICKANEYGALCKIRDYFLPKLQDVLLSAYSGDPEKMKAGQKAIEKQVTDPAVRQELLKVIQPKQPEL